MPQTLSAGTTTPVRDRSAALSQALLDENSFATTMLVIFVDRNGMSALNWSPETIRMELEQEFGIEIPPRNLNKLLAAAAVVTTNYFYKSLSRFLSLSEALATGDFDHAGISLPDAGECAWAITEAILLNPAEVEQEEEPFSQDICNYIGQIVASEGFVNVPDVLQIAIGANAADQINKDWTDDPEMFSAIYQVQADKGDQVRQMIKQNLTELIQQVRALPLEHGDVKQLIEKLPKELQTAATGAA